MQLSKFWNTETFFELALPALTTLFGLQLLRTLIPGLVWYLGDTLGASSLVRGVVALAVFGAAFLVIPFYRALSLRRGLIVALVGISVVRALEQVSTIQVLDFTLAIVGVILFTFFFPLYLAYTRARGDTAPRKYARGFLLGVIFDTTLHGAFHTLDLTWQPGWSATTLVVFLVAIQLWLVYRLPGSADAPTDSSLLTNIPFAAIGPLVFMMAVILQNIARAATLTGLPMPIGFSFVALTNAIGISAALLSIIPERQTWAAMLIGTGFLGFLASRAYPAAGTADMLYLFGNLLLFPFLTVIFSGLAGADRPGITRIAIANGIGWLGFGTLTLLYYVSYDINIGFSNTLLPPVAVILVGLAAVLALRRMPHWLAASNWTSATLAFLLFLIPLIIWANWQRPAWIPGKGYPVRVMTYNLHNGFNTDGRLDPEALARTIEQAQPDIVGLQEVERGWYIDGSIDLVLWLSRRLQMPYVFGSTAGQVWGNAILSRYPVIQSGNVPLPPRDLLLKRGMLWARIDIGAGEELLFIVTHYHHLADGTAIRQQQSPEIVKFWNQRAHTVFVGDLNATPDTQEIAMLRAAGLQDVAAALGADAQCTWPAIQPVARIDYIWTSPDLKARDLLIPESTASDHLGIAVTVEKK